MARKKILSIASKIARRLPPSLAVDLIHASSLPRDLLLRGRPIHNKDPAVERRQVNQHYSRTLPGGLEKSTQMRWAAEERFNAVKNEIEGDVAEIGCADGFFSRGFAKLGHRAIGVDFSEHLVRLANRYKKKTENPKRQFCPWHC